MMRFLPSFPSFPSLPSVCLWLGCSIAGAGAALAAESLDSIIAVVNDEPITRKEVEREAERLALAETPPEDAAQRALEELIDRRLQLQRAQEQRVVIQDQQLAQRINVLMQELGITDEAALKETVAKEFLMTLPEFREHMRESMQIQALFYREVFLATQVYDEEVDQFLKQEGVGQQREYRLRHILIAVGEGDDMEEKRELAEELREELLAGGDFAALAREHSRGALAERGGDLGYKGENDLPDVFLAEAQNMGEGEVSEVISTARGFHLLRLEGTRGGDLRDTIRNFRLAHVFIAIEQNMTDEEKAARAERAQEVWRGIADEESFLRAVKDYSDDSQSIKRGGEIGVLPEPDLPPYFAAVVPAMAEGDISAPVESPFGWHILRVMAVQEQALDLARLREQAKRVLQEQRALSQRETWLGQLRSDAHVRVLDPAFHYDNR